MPIEFSTSWEIHNSFGYSPNIAMKIETNVLEIDKWNGSKTCTSTEYFWKVRTIAQIAIHGDLVEHLNRCGVKISSKKFIQKGEHAHFWTEKIQMIWKMEDSENYVPDWN